MLLHKLDALTLMINYWHYCKQCSKTAYASDFLAFVVMCQYEELTIKDLGTSTGVLHESVLAEKAKRLESWFNLFESFILPIETVKSGDQRTFVTVVQTKHYKLSQQGLALRKASVRLKGGTNDGICPKRFIEACLGTWRNAPLTQHITLLLIYRFPQGFETPMVKGNYIEGHNYQIPLSQPLNTRIVTSALQSLKQFGIIEKYFKDTDSLCKLAYLSKKACMAVSKGLYDNNSFVYQPVIQSIRTDSIPVSYPVTIDDIDLPLVSDLFSQLTLTNYRHSLTDLMVLLYLLKHSMAKATDLKPLLAYIEGRNAIYYRLARHGLLTIVRDKSGLPDNCYRLSDIIIELFARAKKTSPQPYHAIDPLNFLQRILHDKRLPSTANPIYVTIIIHLFYASKPTAGTIEHFFTKPLLGQRLYDCVKGLKKRGLITVDQPTRDINFFDRKIMLSDYIIELIESSLSGV